MFWVCSKQLHLRDGDKSWLATPSRCLFLHYNRMTRLTFALASSLAFRLRRSFS